MANVLGRAAYIERGGSELGVAKAGIGGTQMWLNRGRAEIWSNDSILGRWTVGHESLHTFGLDDERGFNGRLAYRWAEPGSQERSAYDRMRNTPQALRNPDHLMDEVY